MWRRHRLTPKCCRVPGERDVDRAELERPARPDPLKRLEAVRPRPHHHGGSCRKNWRCRLTVHKLKAPIVPRPLLGAACDVFAPARRHGSDEADEASHYDAPSISTLPSPPTGMHEGCTQPCVCWTIAHVNGNAGFDVEVMQIGTSTNSYPPPFLFCCPGGVPAFLSRPLRQ